MKCKECNGIMKTKGNFNEMTEGLFENEVADFGEYCKKCGFKMDKM